MVSDVRRSDTGSDLRKNTTSAPAQVSKLSTTVDQDNITPKDKEHSNCVRFFDAIFNLLCICSELSKILSGCEQFHLRGQQGRIYVANEYPAVARTMLIVCQKPRILRLNTLDWWQRLSVLMKKMQILGWNTKILKFFITLLWEVKNLTPTSTVVRIP